jgi:hypothetical protein
MDTQPTVEELPIEEVLERLRWETPFWAEPIRWEAGQPVKSPTNFVYTTRVGGDTIAERGARL